MVQKGKFSAGTDCLEIKLKVEDFPMLAIPTIPSFKELIPDRPKRDYDYSSAETEGAED
jgi:hypothetical protein